jgi:hypothetical protein
MVENSMNSRNSRNYVNFLFFIFCFLLYASSLEAKVSGYCSNCHTMHNSQNGSAMAYDFDGVSFTKTSTPKGSLLIYSCLGCHSATDGTTWKDPFTKAPIVFNTSPPQYGASSDGGTTYQGLAGGNFYWVKTDDVKGHNIFADNPDDNLSTAPGTWGFGTCGTNSCHANMSGTVSGCTSTDLNGRQGCTKCHLFVGADGLTRFNGYHHANDGTGTKYVDTRDKGWYRFVSTHGVMGYTSGVKGIEDEDWQKTSSATDHNEYFGNITDMRGTSQLMVSGNNTTTAFCCGCHGMFHHEDDTAVGASPWFMHPSDFALTAGEYAAYTTYDPLVPVARPSGFNWAGGPSSKVSGTDGDMVMCLSCHRAHGSPYFKMLRWDYKGWPGNGGTNGCNVCHTTKK